LPPHSYWLKGSLSNKSNRSNRYLIHTVMIIIRKMHHQYVLVTKVTIVKPGESALLMSSTSNIQCLTQWGKVQEQK